MRRRAPLIALATALGVACALGPGCGTAGPGFAPGDGSTEALASEGSDGPAFGDGGGDGFYLLDSGCATATAEAYSQPVYMLVVLDGSGSMGLESKWAAVVPALDALFDDLLAKADPTFGVGLTVFSDSHDPTCQAMLCNGPYNVMQIPIRFVDSQQAAALHARIDLTSPMDGTPSYAVLSGQYPLLESYVPQGALAPNGKKVLVFITDGVPNGGSGEQQQCIAAAQTEFGLGAPMGPVTTFVVGVGAYQPLDPTSYDPVFLGHLAVAGGAPKPGCDPNQVIDPSTMCHFQITPGGGTTAMELEQDFVAAIDAIRGELTSCEFALEKPDGGGAIDPSKVNVVYDDGTGSEVLVPLDALNGWTYDDPANPTKVILHGKACADMKSHPNGSIHIVLGCETVVR